MLPLRKQTLPLETVPPTQSTVGINKTSLGVVHLKQTVLAPQETETSFDVNRSGAFEKRCLKVKKPLITTHQQHTHKNACSYFVFLLTKSRACLGVTRERSWKAVLNGQERIQTQRDGQAESWIKDCCLPLAMFISLVGRLKLLEFGSGRKESVKWFLPDSWSRIMKVTFCLKGQSNRAS